MVRDQRPELVSRMPGKDAKPPNQTESPLDVTLASQFLGLTTYLPWENTFLSGIDECLKWEATA